MGKTNILGVQLNHRNEHAEMFQDILTDHGCIIKTRVGIHNATDGACSPNGVILLDIIGSDDDIEDLENAIKSIPETQVQKMSFEI